MSRAWRHFLSRAAIAIALGMLIIVAPLPVWTPRWFAYFQVPVVVFLFVCYLGKLLYDTLFYNRYCS